MPDLRPNVPHAARSAPASFGEERRLRDPADFRAAFDTNRSCRGRTIVAWVAASGGEGWRLGVVASKRTFPRSVDRSRAKRLVREAFRLNWGAFSGSGNLVVVARRALLDAKRQDVEADLLKVMRSMSRDGEDRRCAR